MVVLLKDMDTKLLTIALLFFTTFCFAQTQKDTLTVSPLKTMSAEQYNAFTNGVDINNVAAVADLNHYPNPQKTLDWKKELALTADQFKQITAINTELNRKMKEMGALIIKNEITLDNMFRTKKLDDGTLIFYAQRTDLFKGELRNAILQAYVKVSGILNFTQRLKYADLQKVHH